MADVNHIKHGPLFQDLTGQRFSHLLVIEFSHTHHTPSGQGYTVWKCNCDRCGATTLARAGSLRSGTKKSCGCLSIEQTKKRSTTHGMSRTPLYAAWWAMICRCENKNINAFSYYGGRGIRVCERWKSTFTNFFDDFGKDQPSAKHTIDRVNNNGNYSCGKCAECIKNGWPMNVRWATRIEQQFNRRITKLIALDGLSDTASGWARRKGMAASCIIKRLARGWSIKDALNPRLAGRVKKG